MVELLVLMFGVGCAGALAVGIEDWLTSWSRRRKYRAWVRRELRRPQVASQAAGRKAWR